VIAFEMKYPFSKIKYQDSHTFPVIEGSENDDEDTYAKFYVSVILIMLFCCSIFFVFYLLKCDRIFEDVHQG